MVDAWRCFTIVDPTHLQVAWPKHTQVTELDFKSKPWPVEDCLPEFHLAEVVWDSHKGVQGDALLGKKTIFYSRWNCTHLRINKKHLEVGLTTVLVSDLSPHHTDNHDETNFIQCPVLPKTAGELKPFLPTQGIYPSCAPPRWLCLAWRMASVHPARGNVCVKK